MVILDRRRIEGCVCGRGWEREREVGGFSVVRGYLRNVNGAIQQMEKIGY